MHCEDVLYGNSTTKQILLVDSIQPLDCIVDATVCSIELNLIRNTVVINNQHLTHQNPCRMSEALTDTASTNQPPLSDTDR